MIQFIYNTSFRLSNEKTVSEWVAFIAKAEGATLKKVFYNYVSPKDIRALNKKHLSHDYYTDVISFDESKNNALNGNIAISVERVSDNASKYSVSFEEELRRVMIHGVLHFMGYNDSNENEITTIRKKEDYALSMFHVKQ